MPRLLALSFLLIVLGVPGMRDATRLCQAQQSSLQTESTPSEGLPTATLQDPLTRIDELALDGKYAEALATLVASFEDRLIPSSEGVYEVMWRKSFDWFAKASQSERGSLVVSCDGTSSTGGSGSVPLSAVLRTLVGSVSSTNLKTPEAMGLLAGWCWQVGSYPTAAAYAIRAIETAPNGAAAPQAARWLVLMDVHKRDLPALGEDVRMIARQMPGRPVAAWAIVQANWCYGASRQAQTARDIDRAILSSSSGTAVAEATAGVLVLMEAAQSRNYRQVIEQLQRIRQYNRPCQTDQMVEAILSGIDWTKGSRNAEVRAQWEDALRQMRGIVESGSSVFSADMGSLVLSRLQERVGQGDEAIKTLMPFTVSGAADEDMGYRPHALAHIGMLLWRSDVKRAAESLESFVKDYPELSIWDDAAAALGGLYLKQHRYEEALGVFRQIDQRRKTGSCLSPARADHVGGGLAASYFGLGRIGEASAALLDQMRQMSREEAARKLRLATHVGYGQAAGFAQRQLDATSTGSSATSGGGR